MGLSVSARCFWQVAQRYKIGERQRVVAEIQERKSVSGGEISPTQMQTTFRSHKYSRRRSLFRSRALLKIFHPACSSAELYVLFHSHIFCCALGFACVGALLTHTFSPDRALSLLRSSTLSHSSLSLSAVIDTLSRFFVFCFPFQQLCILYL